MNNPTEPSQRCCTCERIASMIITDCQLAVSQTDFPTSSIFCLHVGFPTWSDWNYVGFPTCRDSHSCSKSSGLPTCDAGL